MDRDDVIRMAREAGVHHINLDDDYIFTLERFVALVAAAEREACAKVCETLPSFRTNTCDHFAFAIRARGEQ